MLPTALIVGPQRAGTTWIYRYLLARGDVACPRNVKETFFFDRYHDRGAKWYARFFESAGNTRLTVEVAPSYFHDAAVPVRVHDTLGDATIVITLRDPVDRIVSLYHHLVRYGEIQGLGFAQALAAHPFLYSSNLYFTHVQRWRSVFGAQRLSILFQDELQSDPDSYVARLCEALDLPYIAPPSELDEPVNQSAVAPNERVARAASRVAAGLRHVGLYRAVAFAKRLGLKRLALGSNGNARPSADIEALAPYVPELLVELENLEGLLSADLARWKSRLRDLQERASTRIPN